MKQYAVLSLLVLVGLSGCWRNRKKEQQKNNGQVVAMTDSVNIPLATEENNFLLDENLDELMTIADDSFDGVENQNVKTQISKINVDDEFSWIEETSENDRQFKNVYFAFDSCDITPDQEENLHYNIALAKRIVDEHLLFGDKSHQPTIVIDGNSCHSAGSKAYNLVLSEQRAGALQERFVAAGISRDYIKIVGRGSEIPVIKDGKVVTGDRQQQWPNRRDEVHITFS